MLFLCVPLRTEWGFPGGAVVKDLPADAGDVRDAGSSPGREDLLEKEMATHSSILAWEIPKTEGPGGLQSMGSHSQTQLSVQAWREWTEGRGRQRRKEPSSERKKREKQEETEGGSGKRRKPS